jgi:hypothetical protein
MLYDLFSPTFPGANEPNREPAVRRGTVENDGGFRTIEPNPPGASQDGVGGTTSRKSARTNPFSAGRPGMIGVVRLRGRPLHLALYGWIATTAGAVEAGAGWDAL